MKNEATDWEKLFIHQRLVCRIYKEISNLNKKSKQPNENVGKISEQRHITKENMQTACKHMKIHSTSLIIRFIQINNIASYHNTPITIVDIKKLIHIKFCQ